MNVTLPKMRKKTTVASLALLVMALNNKLGLGIDPGTMKVMGASLIGFLGAQGVADIGKSKAETEKAA